MITNDPALPMIVALYDYGTDLLQITRVVSRTTVEGVIIALNKLGYSETALAITEALEIDENLSLETLQEFFHESLKIKVKY